MSNLEIAQNYPPPLDQLLRLGQPQYGKQSFDYASLGLTPQNIPDLLRLVADQKLHNAPGNTNLIWAPVHAWRALAEFRAVAAVGPLLDLLRRIDDHDDDWVGEEVPRVLGQIGFPALEPVTAYLANANHKEWARIAAARTLAQLGEQHPALRPECVARLSAQLERFEEQSGMLNAFLVSPLLDLKAREALPMMERAFAAGCVDESICGDYEDAEIELGLKIERQHAPRPNSLTQFYDDLPAFNEDELLALDEKEDFDWATPPALPVPQMPLVKPKKTGRNEPCPCGSGKKYKKCCGQ